MLYFILNTKDFKGDNHVIEWHVGEKKPEIWQFQGPNAPRRFVAVVFADGDELEYIREKFKNLLDIHHRSVTWSGDFAKFIYDNL